MEMVFRAVLFYLCIHASAGGVSTYKAAVATGNFRNGLNDFLPQLTELKEQRADIVLLATEVPVSDVCSDLTCGPEYHDELARAISEAAKELNVYIVSHLYEKIQCEGRVEILRGNYVFDRKGGIVSVYKRPINDYAVCNTTYNDMATFSTDFGADFLLLMNDDVISQDVESLKMKNLIVTGGSKAGTAYVRDNHLISSLSYIADAYIISDTGIYGNGLQNDLVHEISKDKVKSNELIFQSNGIKSVEDLDHYVIRPLDMEASRHGYSQNVCHGEFCCEFYVKTKNIEESDHLRYGLAVFDGSRQIGGHFVGIETCELVACAIGDGKECDITSEKFNISFEKIIITGNFTKDQSTQFPVILTDQTSLSPDSFSFVSEAVKDVKQVTVEVSDMKNIKKIGILGHDYSQDVNKLNSYSSNIKAQYTSDYYEYIFNEDVVEFFDSLWIRLRIVLFLVSVYILEMM